MRIVFEATPSTAGARRIVRLPADASGQLPSRGMAMVRGTLGGAAFEAAVEPDGKGGHWLELAPGQAGEGTLRFDVEPIDDWPEPDIPRDIADAIVRAGLTGRWDDLTAKARWAWFRWIRAAANPATRQKRIEVACSKLSRGDQRPCCFNASGCTVPDVSKSGILID